MNQTPETRSKSSLDTCKTHRKGLLEPPLKLAFCLQMICFSKGASKELLRRPKDDPLLSWYFLRCRVLPLELNVEKRVQQIPTTRWWSQKIRFHSTLDGVPAEKKTMEMGRNPQIVK